MQGLTQKQRIKRKRRRTKGLTRRNELLQDLGLDDSQTFYANSTFIFTRKILRHVWKTRKSRKVFDPKIGTWKRVPSYNDFLKSIHIARGGRYVIPEKPVEKNIQKSGKKTKVATRPKRSSKSGNKTK